MGLGSALSTAVSGLNANQSNIDVIGNNLANISTTAFKSFRSEFVNNFLSTTSLGSSPGASTSGTNPRQVGQGARIGSYLVNTANGSPTQTGLQSDLYIQGNGYFVVRNGTEQLYTRSGAFRTNSTAQLVSAEGYVVQGFGVDDEFNLQTNALTDITIPLGSLQVAEATSTAFMEGTLNPQGDVATQGTQNRSLNLSTNQAAYAAVAGTDLLRNIFVQDLGDTSGQFNSRLIEDDGTFFQAGDTYAITYTPRLEGRSLAPVTIYTDQDVDLDTLMAMVRDAMGVIQNNPAAPGTVESGYVVNSGATETNIDMVGNLGSVNDFEISPNDFTIEITDSATASRIGRQSSFNLDFPDKIVEANGESAVTTFQIYDSLGATVQVEATIYLADVGTNVSTFTMLLLSPDNLPIPTNLGPPVDLNSRPIDRRVGTFDISFDGNGQIRPVSGNTITIDRTYTGAEATLTTTINVDDFAALVVDNSELAVVSQDGSPPGTLTDYGIDADGMIIGAFDNGVTRILGQVALARFANPAGLVQLNNNVLREGPNSGLPFVTSPGGSVGTILSGFLELSNVDISQSFVDLITASTAFSANSRVVGTSQDLFQVLLQLPR